MSGADVTTIGDFKISSGKMCALVYFTGLWISIDVSPLEQCMFFFPTGANSNICNIRNITIFSDGDKEHALLRWRYTVKYA